MPRLILDDEVAATLTAELAISAARRALCDAYSGRLCAPPRLRADIGQEGIVLTAGGYADGPRGARIYLAKRFSSDQAVLVWGDDGHLMGCVVGVELGARRTGALGGVAIDVLAEPDAEIAAVIGSGRQAWTQLWALSAIRRLRSVRIFSPTPGNRDSFTERARGQLNVDAHSAASPREAVEGADIVILASRAERPVIETSWVKPGAHINTIGPKTASAHEAPPELAARCRVVASDSPIQAESYGEALFTTEHLTHLGGILSGELKGRTSTSDTTLYVSTGLAGSEVVTAAALLEMT